MFSSDAPSSRRRGESSGTLVSAVSNMASLIRELALKMLTLVRYTMRFLWSLILMKIRSSTYAWFLENERQFKMLKEFWMKKKNGF